MLGSEWVRTWEIVMAGTLVLSRARCAWVLRIVCLGAASLVALPFVARAAADPAHPEGPAPTNVVLILVDDLGWKDLGCYGSPTYRTPNIDALAREGVRFTDAYSACTVCSPTRASLLTGRYPARLRVTDWIPGHVRRDAPLRVPEWTKRLEHTQLTLAEVMRDREYATATIGKWHLGPKSHRPETHGFGLNVGGYRKGQPPSFFSPYRIPSLVDGPDGEYLTDREAEEAIHFITKNREKPFFLYLPHYAVHTPIQAKAAMVEAEREHIRELGSAAGGQRNPHYSAMVRSVDEAVGRIRASLEALGVAERTAIIFASDNGGLSRVTDNRPLRAGKGSAYEGGVRTPLIVSWPGVSAAGTTCDIPVITPDLFATIVSLTEAKLPKGHGIDGESLEPALRGEGWKRGSLFWHYPHYHPGGATPHGAIRHGPFKLIEFYEDHRVELYDLSEDIGETKNLADRSPDVRDELLGALRRWRREVGAQMPLPNPNVFRETPAHPDFDRVHRMRVEAVEHEGSPIGHQLESRAVGWALRRLPEPRRRVTIHLETRCHAAPWRNAFVVMGGDPEHTAQHGIRAGLFVGRGELAIFSGQSRTDSATTTRVPLPDASIAWSVTADLDTATITLGCRRTRG
ncbi:MAG: sulfatase, partial [Planctomycetota bacterium]